MLFLSVYSVIIVLFILGIKTALLPIILIPSSVMSSYGLEMSCALMAQRKAHPSQCKMFVFLSCVNIVCFLFILCVDSLHNAVRVFWRAQLRVLLFL